jgi:hypothetical protein
VVTNLCVVAVCACEQPAHTCCVCQESTDQWVCHQVFHLGSVPVQKFSPVSTPQRWVQYVGKSGTRSVSRFHFMVYLISVGGNPLWQCWGHFQCKGCVQSEPCVTCPPPSPDLDEVSTYLAAADFVCAAGLFLWEGYP